MAYHRAIHDYTRSYTGLGVLPLGLLTIVIGVMSRGISKTIVSEEAMNQENRL